MSCLSRRFFIAGIFLIIFVSFNHSIFAQYQVFTWENLEKGEFPATLTRMHGSTPETVSVYEYPLTGAIPGMVTQTSQKECGKYGIKLQSTLKQNFLSIMTQLLLKREKLGEKGRALFQADIFVGGPEADTPNIAVVAYGGKGVESKYRFGMLQKKSLYFSFLDGKKPDPVKFEQQPFDAFGLKRPGWHRFQIIFEGQENIYLAVDGRYTSFSPIKESSVQNLQLGIMLASQAKPAVVYIDNLSVQWTPEDVPLPESPWEITQQNNDMASASSNSGSNTTSLGKPAFSDQSGIVWASSPDEAWKQASAAKLPIVVYFQVPRSNTCISFESILLKDQSIISQMKKFMCLKVDLNTLAGGMIGQKFQIFRVPTMLIISAGGAEVARQTFVNDVSAQSVISFLQKSSNP